MSKTGRPQKDGERYPSGKLKPNEGISPALFARIKTDGVKFFGDPRFATQLAYLALQGELTNRQAAAGLRFGEIYQRWYRLNRMKTSPKSPSLERGFSGAAELADERMSDDQIANLEETARKASADLKWVLTEVPVYPREVHSALIDLCVDNQPISSLFLPEIRTQLNRLATLFDSRDGRKRRTSRDGKRPLRAKVEQRQEERPTHKPAQATLRAVEAVVRKLRPDLDAEGIKLVNETVMALAARDRLRAQKGRT